MSLVFQALNAHELRSLAGLRFYPRRTFAGRIRGERLSRQKGVSVEFADYRDYADGDDLRHLDWNILARLERPTIRTYQDEDDLAVYVALDTSASMDFGTPSKRAHVLRLAAALGWVALAGQDAVYPVALGGQEGAMGRALRGRGSFAQLTRWLSDQPIGQERGLASSLERLGRAGSFRPGLFVCLTDGLDPAAPQALRAIAARGHELLLIQVLSPIELDPDLEGDLRLVDAEGGAAVEITAHGETIAAYKRNLDAHCRALEETTLRQGGRMVRSVVGQPLREFVTHSLRRVGVVR